MGAEIPDLQQNNRSKHHESKDLDHPFEIEWWEEALLETRRLIGPIRDGTTERVNEGHCLCDLCIQHNCFVFKFCIDDTGRLSECSYDVGFSSSQAHAADRFHHPQQAFLSVQQHSGSYTMHIIRQWRIVMIADVPFKICGLPDGSLIRLADLE